MEFYALGLRSRTTRAQKLRLLQKHPANDTQTAGGSLALMAAMWQLLLMTETKRFQLDVLLRAALPPDVTFVLVFEKMRSHTLKRQSSLMHHS